MGSLPDKSDILLGWKASRGYTYHDDPREPPLITLDCIILSYIILYLIQGGHPCDRRVTQNWGNARDVDCPRVLWKFSQLINLVPNLNIPLSGNSTGMTSVIIPIAYLVVIFGGLYVFSVLYRRHIAGESTHIVIVCATGLRSNVLYVQESKSTRTMSHIRNETPTLLSCSRTLRYQKSR
jgi:hypothetical protein